MRVVVGVAGRPDCENAIGWGAIEAAARGAELQLVYAFVRAEFRIPLGPSDVAPGHLPDLLILDEPTSGLDPLMQRGYRALLGETDHLLTSTH